MGAVVDTNAGGNNDQSLVSIVGPNDIDPVDTITENGVKKLQVKATSVPQPLGNLVFKHALNGGSNQMAVDGSGAAVDFIVSPDASYDTVIESLAFESFANGIKIDKFLSLNSDLTNGLLIEVKSEDSIFQFLPITNTQEFDSHFSYGPGRSFSLVFASGNDSMVARFGPKSSFLLKKQGTYPSDDYIKISIRDDISSINSLQFITFGALDV